MLLTADVVDATAMEVIQLGVNGVITKGGAQTVLVACLVKVPAGEKWIEQSILQSALDIITGDKVSDPLPSALRVLVLAHRRFNARIDGAIRRRNIVFR